MCSQKTNYQLINVMIFLVLFLPFQNVGAKLREKSYLVSIINNLKNSSVPLRIHCQSKDDNLGYHDLSYDQSFDFKFEEQIFFRTLFFCHFWWPPKQNIFDVFNNRNRCIKHGPFHTHTCIWSANLDGLSLNGVKIHDWSAML
ncbi:hypothetical protein R3W88_025814 [Solanum pinnatisectum]|uniref:S-protein homolog n=1 Tax=Solanum pinnatisectum TaxID=50273 RepID=A0AAV9M4S9_9SOLN|nr:hypothetical protein R3W88_025814 [Solanum pinnatisectum]